MENEIKLASTQLNLKNEAYKPKLINFISKKANDATEFEIDKKIKEMRSNPKTAAELGFFLMDTEEYKKYVSSEKVTNEHLNYAKKFKFSKGGTPAEKETSREKSTKLEGFDIESLP